MIEYFSKVPITKGRSGDTKNRVTTAEGINYLLRISPFDLHDSKKATFEMMQRLTARGVPMCRQVESGVCEEAGREG